MHVYWPLFSQMSLGTEKRILIDKREQNLDDPVSHEPGPHKPAQTGRSKGANPEMQTLHINAGVISLSRGPATIGGRTTEALWYKLSTPTRNRYFPRPLRLYVMYSTRYN